MVKSVKPRVAGDLVKWETQPGYTRFDGYLVNADPNVTPPNRDIADVIGLPVGGTVAAPAILYATDEANCIGLVVSGEAIQDIADDGVTPQLYGILGDGPALIDPDEIALADPAGVAYTQATILTALLALGIKEMEKPTATEIQTT